MPVACIGGLSGRVEWIRLGRTEGETAVGSCWMTGSSGEEEEKRKKLKLSTWSHTLFCSDSVYRLEESSECDFFKLVGLKVDLLYLTCDNTVCVPLSVVVSLDVYFVGQVWTTTDQRSMNTANVCFSTSSLLSPATTTSRSALRSQYLLSWCHSVAV